MNLGYLNGNQEKKKMLAGLKTQNKHLLRIAANEYEKTKASKNITMILDQVLSSLDSNDISTVKRAITTELLHWVDSRPNRKLHTWPEAFSMLDKARSISHFKTTREAVAEILKQEGGSLKRLSKACPKNTDTAYEVSLNEKSVLIFIYSRSPIADSFAIKTKAALPRLKWEELYTSYMG